MKECPSIAATFLTLLHQVSILVIKLYQCKEWVLAQEEKQDKAKKFSSRPTTYMNLLSVTSCITNQQQKTELFHKLYWENLFFIS